MLGFKKFTGSLVTANFLFYDQIAQKMFPAYWLEEKNDHVFNKISFIYSLTISYIWTIYFGHFHSQLSHPSLSRYSQCAPLSPSCAFFVFCSSPNFSSAWTVGMLIHFVSSMLRRSCEVTKFSWWQLLKCVHRCDSFHFCSLSFLNSLQWIRTTCLPRVKNLRRKIGFHYIFVTSGGQVGLEGQLGSLPTLFVAFRSSRQSGQPKCHGLNPTDLLTGFDTGWLHPVIIIWISHFSTGNWCTLSRYLFTGLYELWRLR